MTVVLKKFRYIVIVLGIIVLLLSIMWLCSSHNIEFEFVEEITPVAINDEYAWFSMRDKEYEGFFDVEELLSNNYGIEIDTSKYDFENYTYIITVGHKLNKIEYNYTVFKNRKMLVLPDQLIGIVLLDSKATNSLYVYKIPKMNIDCDYHAPMNKVQYN